ncbi:MAG: bifunctional folylpolyglutamate synthase/dihydrofolate synthase [Treponema sp.]|jgi:dihydrofolate synthase/folylpolyglutamate synthase|nr:bifunctional folylpolyglutamate synthase/dihydrofolate synthase [Treponema sp.]
MVGDTVGTPESEKIYSWLCSFISLERGLGGKAASAAEEHFKLDRIRILADMADHPENSAPVLHVAGSKGKGSVTAMIASMLEAAGKKTARYMSPHVSNWRERISLGGGFFPEPVYTAAGKELQQLCRNYKDSPPARHGGEPTFFELATLYFFLCARIARCGALVVETGLGGRLDATNIVDPLVSVITVIEKEHTGFLGNTLEAIASEKAGIIKAGRPVVLAEQGDAVREVFVKTAAERNAPLLYLPDHVEIRNIRIHREGTDCALRFSASPAAAKEAALTVPIPGRIQADNAALAVLAVRTAFPGLPDCPGGLAKLSLPARFERLDKYPPLIVDGAHTPASITQCAATFRELYGKGILLFGCASDKDAETMAGILVPRFFRCIVTAPGKVRDSEPRAVYEAFIRSAEAEEKRTGSAPPKILLIPDTAEAVTGALGYAKERELPLLVCGSFYLAGEIRNMLMSPGRRASVRRSGDR